jgi:glycosyltransferase involved in cell wall biosynthesis
LSKTNPTVVLVGGGSIIGGKEVMMLTLGRGLKRAGARVAFITSLWGGKDEFVARLKSEAFEYHRVRLGFLSISLQWKPIIWTLFQLFYWPALVVGYLRAVRSIRPDVVIHTNWHHALLLLPFLDRRRDIYWNHEAPPHRWHYGFVFRAIAARVSGVVCVSHAAARALERLGVGATRITIIHNGIAELGCACGNTAGRALAGAMAGGGALYDEPLSIGIVGQIGSWKGHDDLLEAFRALSERYRGLTLRIYGANDGPYCADLRQRIATLGLAGRVAWTGFLSDRRLIYESMDICVVPSRIEEALGNVAIEASQCGLPVIATMVGGLPEVVEDGVTGLLVAPSAPRELEMAIERLLESRELRTRMGANGRKRVAAYFSEAVFIRSFLSMVKSGDRVAAPVR